MKRLVVIVLACWVVGSDASPRIAERPSNSAGFMGIRFADFIPFNWMIFKNSPAAPSTTNSAPLTTKSISFTTNSASVTTNSRPLSTSSVSKNTHSAPITTRAANGPLILGRYVKEDHHHFVIGDSSQTMSTSQTTEATSSAPGEAKNVGRLVFAEENLGITIDKPSCLNTRQDLTHVSEEINATECSLAKGLMMHNGSCIRLLATEDCNEGEWLVKVGAGEAECRIRPCPFGQLEYNGTCTNLSDASVCGYGQILYVDFTGKTYCDCEPNFIYDPSSNNCYSQYEQGPCSYGNYMVLSKSCSVECVFNDCKVDGYVRNSVSNVCYRKMYHGFCEVDMQVFHQVNHTVECKEIFNIRNIFDVATLRSCPAGSRHDHAGSCRELFRVPSVTSLPSLYGGCSNGFSKGPRGICRRTMKLFG